MPKRRDGGGRFASRAVAKKKRAASPRLPTGPLADLLAWWKAAKVDGALIGGLAVSLHTKPRATDDVDAVIDIDDARLEGFLALGREHGFRPRISDPIEFARSSRMVLVEHVASGINVDLAIAGSEFEFNAIRNVKRVRCLRRIVPLLRVEDLIVMKSVAGRDIDRVDIAQMLRFFPDLDLAYVRRLVGQFAELTDAPEILDDFERLASKR